MKPKFVKFMLTAAIVAALQTSNVAWAEALNPDCDKSTSGAVIQAAAEAEKTRAVQVIKDSHAVQSVMLQNAMNCLQRIKDLLGRIAVPTFPDLIGGSLEAILAYLANQACRVVEGALTKAIPAIPQVPSITTIPGGPEIKPATTTWGKAIDNPTAGVDKVITQTTTAGQTYSTTADATVNAATNPPSSGTIWDSVSCAFGANNANCKK